MNNSLNNGLNQSKGSVFGKDAGGKSIFIESAFMCMLNVNTTNFVARQKQSLIGTAGQQVMSGYGSFASQGTKNNRSFHANLLELEEDIAETRKELNFCKKEVQILNTERSTVLEMAETKCIDIEKYLAKEIHYLEELISKAQTKQKAENSRFAFQCQQVKQIANELDDHRMELVKRTVNIEDHLGIETGPLEAEQISLSGKHNDIQDGTFHMQFLGKR